MDTRPDDLSELERNLAALSPANDGLSTDAMLFAAGRASVRPERRRLIWPAISAALALLAIGLGIRLVAEQRENRSLAEKLHLADQRLAAVPPSETAPESLETEGPAADSLIASHRALERGLDPWIATSGALPGPKGTTQVFTMFQGRRTGSLIDQ
jgi:hypothetical protein